MERNTTYLDIDQNVTIILNVAKIIKENEVVKIIFTFNDNITKTDIDKYMSYMRNMYMSLGRNKVDITYDCTKIPINIQLVQRKISFLLSIKDIINKYVRSTTVLHTGIPFFLNNIITGVVKYSDVPVYIIKV